ncbi:hypothetical protein BBJ28_00013341 [Nothophytophthora sp. Chile5]|nr:hypothetical protein BBJ28_00013341 [Nothophytophthora sp. Chile5]
MRGRSGVRGKSRKPNQHKNVSETFEMKEAVLAFYDTHPMAAVVDEFWPSIEKKSKAYTTKVRVVRRWKQQRAHIHSMTKKTTTAQQRRSREQGAAKTLSDDAEQDILEWLVALQSHGVPVSAKMLELEALEVASQMFMLKKKKPQVDTSKQMKAVAWDLSKVALVFLGIRAASVFLNQES